MGETGIRFPRFVKGRGGIRLKWYRRWIKKDSPGQALVELALVLPLLLLLLLGIVEMGRVGNASLTLAHAAREGARVGITGAEDTVITDRIQGAASTLNQEALVIQLHPARESRERGGEFTVTLDYQLPIFVPFLEAFLPNPFPLQGRAVMRLE